MSCTLCPTSSGIVGSVCTACLSCNNCTMGAEKGFVKWLELSHINLQACDPCCTDAYRYGIELTVYTQATVVKVSLW